MVVDRRDLLSCDVGEGGGKAGKSMRMLSLCV